MNKLDWNDYYTTGIERLDDEHKKMFDLINKLLTEAAEGAPKEKLEKHWNELIENSKTHFENEEALMAESGYDLTEEHIEDHKKLLTELTEIQTKYYQNILHYNEKLIEVLKDWLFEHIMDGDMAFSVFYKERG